MSLQERVNAAGNGAILNDEAKALSVANLQTQVNTLLPIANLAQLTVDNPLRARSEVRSACKQILTRMPWAALPLSRQDELIAGVINSIFGLGPLEELLADESITEIMVNGTKSVFFEKSGVLYESSIHFKTDEEVRAIIDRILGPLGRRIDESSPMVNARLPEGYRVNAVLPPVALDGPLLTIRTFSKQIITLEQMEKDGLMSKQLYSLLVWAVKMRKNIAVSGGTGSGKTTILNALSCHISHKERIITIEDSAELRFFEHPHVVRLESRPPSAEGTGEITIRDLLINSLRMRPDRIIVGECRGGEALDMLQAMNTGHDGSLTTLHANTPQDAIARLVTMVRYVADLPVDVIEANIAMALDLIVQVTRGIDGSRFISAVDSISYDLPHKKCVVTPIYQRQSLLSDEQWGSMPSWINSLSSSDVAAPKEVAAWKAQFGK